MTLPLYNCEYSMFSCPHPALYKWNYSSLKAGASNISTFIDKDLESSLYTAGSRRGGPELRQSDPESRTSSAMMPPCVPLSSVHGQKAIAVPCTSPLVSLSWCAVTLLVFFLADTCSKKKNKTKQTKTLLYYLLLCDPLA